jgi:hypothetical protein
VKGLRVWSTDDTGPQLVTRGRVANETRPKSTVEAAPSELKQVLPMDSASIGLGHMVLNVRKHNTKVSADKKPGPDLLQ